MSFVALAGGIADLAVMGGLAAEGSALATGIGAVGAGAIGGAGLGAATSALTGGDVGKGALFGALGGGLTGGIGSAFGGGAGAAGGAATAAPGASPIAAGATGSTGSTLGAGLGGTGGGIGIGTESAINPALTQAFANTTPGILNSAEAAMPGTLANNAGQVGQLIGSTPSATGGALASTASPYAGTFFGQNPLMTIGAGATLAQLLNTKPTSATSQAVANQNAWNPLAYYKFDPRRFQASQPTYIRTGFADGGITSLTSPDPAMMQSGPAKVDFMGQDAYPTSQQKLSFYSSPTQMPTSAQQAMASYEPNTNPLTGEMINHFARGGIADLGGYSDGGQLLRGPGDGVSDSIPADISGKQPARLADGEFVVPARIVSELGNGSTDAGARQLYAMMDRVQKGRRKTTGKGKVAVDSKAHKALPA